MEMSIYFPFVKLKPITVLNKIVLITFLRFNDLALKVLILILIAHAKLVATPSTANAGFMAHKASSSNRIIAKRPLTDNIIAIDLQSNCRYSSTIFSYFNCRLSLVVQLICVLIIKINFVFDWSPSGRIFGELVFVNQNS